MVGSPWGPMALQPSASRRPSFQRSQFCPGRGGFAASNTVWPRPVPQATTSSSPGGVSGSQPQSSLVTSWRNQASTAPGGGTPGCSWRQSGAVGMTLCAAGKMLAPNRAASLPRNRLRFIFDSEHPSDATALPYQLSRLHRHADLRVPCLTDSRSGEVMCSGDLCRRRLRRRGHLGISCHRLVDSVASRVNPSDVVVLGIVCHRLGEVVVGTVAFRVNADGVVTLAVVCRRLAEAVGIPVDLNDVVALELDPVAPVEAGNADRMVPERADDVASSWRSA